MSSKANEEDETPPGMGDDSMDSYDINELQPAVLVSKPSIFENLYFYYIPPMVYDQEDEFTFTKLSDVIVKTTYKVEMPPVEVVTEIFQEVGTMEIGVDLNFGQQVLQEVSYKIDQKAVYVGEQGSLARYYAGRGMEIEYSEDPLNGEICFMGEDESLITRALDVGKTVIYDNTESWNFENSDLINFQNLDGNFFAFW
jgi:hypothetical protein